MPEISLIIPVYNVEKYLKRCLDSVLAQTFEDFEAILVDDGSPDRSGNICDEYAKMDSRFRVIHKQNRGVSAARNTGINAAKGISIVLADSDDELEPYYLERLQAADGEMIITGISWRDERGSRIRDYEYSAELVYLNRESVRKMCSNRALNYIFGKRFRTDIIRKNRIRFDEELTIGEDTLFCAEYLSCIKTVQYVSGTPYLYYRYERNTLSTFRFSDIEKLECANKKIEKVLLEFCIAEAEEMKQRWFDVYFQGIVEAANGKNLKVTEKLKIIHTIVKKDKFTELKRNLDIYMPLDAPKVRKIIASCSAVLILMFFKFNRFRNK